LFSTLHGFGAEGKRKLKTKARRTSQELHPPFSNNSRMTISADLDIPLTGTGDEEIERQRHLSLRWQPRRHWPALRNAFGGDETTSAVILALATARDWVAYSRSKSHYGLPRRYRSTLYTYRRVVGAADRLDALGLIEHDRTPPGLRGWQSSMKATPELIAITNKIISARPRLEPAKPPEGILLRDADGALIDYRDTASTMRMRRKLDQINEAIRSTDISDNVASPLVRIFNRDFRRGGRFYAQGGGWQSMKKEARKRITIDGEPVVEIDYKTG
jgi:hypothetical protein